jgi:hypothetical protein
VRGVLLVQTLALLLGSGVLGLAGWWGGITVLAISYSAVILLIALALNIYQWRVNGVFLLPKLSRARRSR